jgi:hypothetical protein
MQTERCFVEIHGLNVDREAGYSDSIVLRYVLQSFHTL